MFEQLRSKKATSSHRAPFAQLKPSSFDWAVHPGGATILRGAQQALNLTEDHLRASLKVYQSHGNSSSPTVLIVLDEMRQMGEGREHVVATSFGPGMTIEMCLMKRCSDDGRALPLRTSNRAKHVVWQSLHSRLASLLNWPLMLKAVNRVKTEYSSLV